VSKHRTKYINVRVGHYIVPVTIYMSGKSPVASFFNSAIPALELPENWNREMIRKHIEKYLDK
jgi:hypothetical protein